MGKPTTLTSQELKDWIGGDAFREALLITEVPIGKTTLSQTLSGSYSPSPRMINAIRAVMQKHPLRKAQGQKAAAG